MHYGPAAFRALRHKEAAMQLRWWLRHGSGVILCAYAPPASAFLIARKSRQAKRFCNGLRSRKAGWNVGMARMSRLPVARVISSQNGTAPSR